MPTPLEDVKILDVTQVVAGSFASMMLADLGAQVTKIERPDKGEIGRSNPPFVNDRSAYFMSVNRNKESVSLDLSSPDGQEAFMKLAQEADVIIENLKPGSMDKFGLDYESVATQSEQIIYCSISGFGKTSPHADLPALDIVAQGFSGNMSITGPEGGKPYRAGIPIGDIAGSMYAAQSVLAALYHRERTEEGQFIDVSMVDGLMSWLTVRAGYSFATEKAYPRMGNKLDEFIPYGVFETKDSYIGIAAVQDNHWYNLCEGIERPELATDERFETTEQRRENREELEAILEGVFKERTTDNWFDRLAEKLPTTPINDTSEVWETEHVKERDMLTKMEIDGDEHPLISPPVNFSQTPTGIRQNPPKLGEHTEKKLREIGYDDEEITKLREKGVIQ